MGDFSSEVRLISLLFSDQKSADEIFGFELIGGRVGPALASEERRATAFSRGTVHSVTDPPTPIIPGPGDAGSRVWGDNSVVTLRS